MNEIAANDAEDGAGAPVGKAFLTRRAVLAGGAGLIGVSAAATSAYAAVVEPQGLVVTRYAPTPRNWPAGRRLSITVIADLHAGGPDMQLPHVQRIVDTAIALKSDLVVLLGDYIARYRFAIERIPEPVWAGNWRASPLRSGSGQSLATTIGGTTLPACAAHSLTCVFRCWKTRR